jgi:hypothetical protein
MPMRMTGSEDRIKYQTYLHARRRRAQGQGQETDQTQHGSDWRACGGWIEVSVRREMIDIDVG